MKCYQISYNPIYATSPGTHLTKPASEQAAPPSMTTQPQLTGVLAHCLSLKPEKADILFFSARTTGLWALKKHKTS